MIKQFRVHSQGQNEIIDITIKVREIVEESKVKEGICNVYACHATCGVVINENHDPNICTDLLNALAKIVPEGKWLHDDVDNNGAAHIKAAMLGPSENIPIKDNKLMLGTWQNIMLVDLDGPRERTLIVTIVKGSPARL